jgi:uncharacterized lipoprotein YajG
MVGYETLSIENARQREVIDMRLFILLSVLLLTACTTGPRGEAPPAQPAASTSNGNAGGMGSGGY